MAKQLSVTVIFFLISFTLSEAQIPSNLPENDAINREVDNPLPESDVTPTVLLPSEASNEDSSHVDSTNGESNTVTFTTVPLQFVSFRPINRRFYTDTLRGRFPLRRCRGRRYSNFKQLGQRLEIPYGDDVILSTAVKKDSSPIHDGEVQIPLRWARLRHRHHNFKPLAQRTEVPYGDDMIESAAMKKDSSPMNFHIREVQIPSKWVALQQLHRHHHNLHLHHDQDELEGISMKREKPHHHHDQDELDGISMKREKTHHHHDEDELEFKSMKREKTHHHHDRDELEGISTKPKKRKQGGLLKRFRKFLNQFEF